MSKQVINTSKAPQPIGPYNQALLVNGFLYVSGQIPLDAETGELTTGNIETATHKVMENIGAILEEAGMSYDDVIKVSIFVRDIDAFKTVNDTYGPYFTGVQPTRETVEVSNLPKHVDVEISCIAAVS